jgi:hypothetical protein
MPIRPLPVKTAVEVPRFPAPQQTGIAAAAAARFLRAVARSTQSLLLALHESRLEKAQREIDNFRHLIPAATEVTGRHALLLCGGRGQPRRGPWTPAEARQEPSHVA